MLDIWQYIASDSEVAASALLRRSDRVIGTLVDNPRMGRKRSDLGNDIRSIAVGNYIIFYRPVAGAIEVVRILHGARDITDQEFG